MTNDDEQPGKRRIVVIEEGRAHGVSAALALYMSRMDDAEKVLLVHDLDQDPPTIRCCDGHSLCARCQAIKDASDPIRFGRVAPHRGKSLMGLMLGLGAKKPEQP